MEVEWFCITIRQSYVTNNFYVPLIMLIRNINAQEYLNFNQYEHIFSFLNERGEKNIFCKAVRIR